MQQTGKTSNRIKKHSLCWKRNAPTIAQKEVRLILAAATQCAEDIIHRVLIIAAAVIVQLPLSLHSLQVLQGCLFQMRYRLRPCTCNRAYKNRLAKRTCLVALWNVVDFQDSAWEALLQQAILVTATDIRRCAPELLMRNRRKAGLAEGTPALYSRPS